MLRVSKQQHINAELMMEIHILKLQLAKCDQVSSYKDDEVACEKIKLLEKNFQKLRQMNKKQQFIIEQDVIQLKQQQTAYDSLYDMYKKVKKLSQSNENDFIPMQSTMKSQTKLIEQKADYTFIVELNQKLLTENTNFKKDISCYQLRQIELYNEIDELTQQNKCQISNLKSFEEEFLVQKNSFLQEIKDLKSEIHNLNNNNKDLKNQLQDKQSSINILEATQQQLVEKSFINSYNESDLKTDKLAFLQQISILQKKFEKKCLQYDLLNDKLNQFNQEAVLDDFPVEKLADYMIQSQNKQTLLNNKLSKLQDTNSQMTNSFEFDDYLSLNDIEMNL